jgi:hypothetical protein
MPVRYLLALTCAAMLLPASAAPAAPDFAPDARQSYDGFVGINAPRADVPVGALWINGYGPTGDGATADNLATVRSVNSLTIDKNLQLAVSVGLLNLFGVDPKARDHYTARFTDLSIVRVKDITKLAGPAGEPRIIEAIKAGSVTVTSDSELGLNARTLDWQSRADGTGASGRTRAYSMEARDMFIAMRVATSEIVRGRTQELRLAQGKSARIDDFLLVLSNDHCNEGQNPCALSIGIAKINTQTVKAVDPVPLDSDGIATLDLPVPISDGRGGLFSKLSVRWMPPCSESHAKGCRKEASLIVQYEGLRLSNIPYVRARGW